MAEIKLNMKNTGISQKSIMEYKAKVENIHKDLHRRANDEKDFVGWLELPTNYNKEEFKRIKKAAKKIKKESDILVVIGIGGSYLGARAVIDALTSSFNNLLPNKQRKYPQILYVGNNLSPNYINELIEYIGDKDFSVNVISKSGTTTSPLFMEFSMPEYWCGLPFPSPGDLPNPGIEPVSPALAGKFFTTVPPGSKLHK